MASFARFKQDQVAITNGTLTASVGDGAILLDAPATLQAGQWITVSASTIPSAVVECDILVVAGGGGGGGGEASEASGGGGAGGVIVDTFTPSVTSYAITIGEGGAGGQFDPTTAGTNGEDSSIATVATATGGGGGGAVAISAGKNGGSGGGGASATETAGGTGDVGEGNNGGTGFEAATGESGGGGGGAGAVGANASNNVGGNGGNGVASSISGTSVTYGGGGGGGSDGTPGTGGTGGGGNGTSGSDLTFSNGTDGLGGGGGGNFGDNPGGSGGRGVVIISYTTGTMSAIGGTITFAAGKTIHTFVRDGTFTVNSIATSGQYFVSYKDSSNKVKLSAIFDPYGLYPIVHGTTGTATFSTLAVPAAGLAKATEPYDTGTEDYYRYYLLDSNSRVWVYDTQVFETTLAANGVGEAWMLPDPTDYSSYDFTGMAILNGQNILLNDEQLFGKPTVNLGTAYVALEEHGVDMRLVNPFPTHTNPAYVGHQGKMYYGDGNFLGQVYPINSLTTGLANVQSYSSFTATGTTGTLTAVISGSSPFVEDAAGAIARVPIVFFSTETTGVPAGIVEGDVYYAQMSATVPRQFTVFATLSGGSALTITTVGTSYFTTFYPYGEQENTANTDVTLFTFTQQRLNLPVFERIQCMVEIGNTLLIGGRTNALYPWNQVNALPSDIITLPESDVVSLLNVNNMAYIFAGNKGNVYITNNSSASLVLKVPDYCAGVPGTPLTYIEPVFTWGDSAFIRGRVYFSILDQTSTKAGNCGGIWSFVPPQNFSFNQDTGVALRLENQNSYGSYNGVASILIANEEQNAVSPQYWTSWQNSYSIATSTAFGIDQTDDIPATTYVIETDLLPTATFLTKKTFAQTEFKLTTPLASGDSVALYWRVNSTAAWTAFTNQINESANLISGYYTQNLQATQWLQLRAVVTTNGTATSSFGRMSEMRVR